MKIKFMNFYQGQNEGTLRLKTIYFFLTDEINKKNTETMVKIFSKIIDI